MKGCCTTAHTPTVTSHSPRHSTQLSLPPELAALLRDADGRKGESEKGFQSSVRNPANHLRTPDFVTLKGRPRTDLCDSFIRAMTLIDHFESDHTMIIKSMPAGAEGAQSQTGLGARRAEEFRVAGLLEPLLTVPLRRRKHDCPFPPLSLDMERVPDEQSAEPPSIPAPSGVRGLLAPRTPTVEGAVPQPWHALYPFN
eukprot:1876817-Rhodomonas_salina.3